MRTKRLQTVMCQWPPPDIAQRGCLQFEHVSSDDHHMSLVEQGWGIPGLMSGGGGGSKVGAGVWTLYSEVKCIMGNNQMETPMARMIDRHN